jgi:hypothetical protein
MDNQRPIKIRTWHKQLHEFVPSHKHNVINKDGEICPSEFVENSMFSGVFAKDRREIYEGDKVRAMYATNYVYEGIVVFSDGSFGIKITKKNNKNHGSDYDSTPELNNFDSIVIIGNIYDE